MATTPASKLPDWARTTEPSVPEGAACSKCKERPAQLKWSTDTTAFIHGWVTYVCVRCAIEEQLEHAKERASVIPELEAWLDELVRAEQGTGH